MSKSRRDELIEEVEWLLGYDNPESIAKRLGYKSSHTLIRKLHLHGAHELAVKVYQRSEAYNAYTHSL